MNPHKHAELIKAWADGAEIEFRNPFAVHPVDRERWEVSPYLAWWDTLLEFRVKPPREFPKTSLSGATLYTVFNNSLRELSKLDGHPTTSNAGSRCQQAAEAVANAAIKQYILDQEAGK